MVHYPLKWCVFEKGKIMVGRLIGAHVSAAGGIENTPQRASEIGCNVVQLFSGSPRVWRKKELDTHNFQDFLAKRKQFGIEKVFTHALYLTNLASDKADLVQKSLLSIKYELEFDARVEGAGVVLHVGSHQGRGWLAARDEVLKQIIALMQSSPDESTLLLENAASHNGKVGNDLAELKWLLDGAEQAGEYVSQGRLGWCLDTCHAWAAGYWLGETEPTQVGEDGRESHQAELFTKDHQETKFPGKTVGSATSRSVSKSATSQSVTSSVAASTATTKTTPAQSKNEDRLLPQALATAIDQLDLWSSLQCVHVNDSKDPFASGRDRHQNLGDGQIPVADFEYLLNLPKLAKLPMVLEVPGIKNEGPDVENVQRLKKLVNISS